jgi:roadblock/LC7 domain-containing protein
MNKKEKRVLHGLYHLNQLSQDEVPFTAYEIAWLIQTPISKGWRWRGEDGKLKSIECDGADYLAKIATTCAAAERSLSYLQAAGYIKYRKEDSVFRVAVTGPGSDVARKLHSCLGRLDVLYKSHKDGVLGLIITILVSCITALLTKHWSK